MTIPSRPLPAALLSGVLLALAFPSHPGHPLAFLYGPAWGWVALAPLLHALAGLRSRRRGFRLAWVCGFVFHLLSLYWIGHTQGGGPAVVAGALLGAAYLGLFTGLFGVAVVHSVRHLGPRAVLAAPLAWTSTEYLLSLGELGFPWMLLGHSQAPWPAVLQHATATGVYGVSFALCLSAALLAAATRLQPPAALAALLGAVAVPAATALGGHLVLEPEAPADVRVGLVQNAMGLEKWQAGGLAASLASLDSLSRRALAADPDLLVWPETSVPCNLDRSAACRHRLRALSDDLQTPILTGAPGTDADTGEPLNSAYLFQPGTRRVPSYAKMHLVPFGERTPLRDSLPLLRDIDWTALTGDLGPAEFGRGRRRTMFPLGAAADSAGAAAHFGVLICFESVFPDLVRRTVAEGARLLVIITNDSWFGPTAGPFQHAAIAVLRAVENRTAVARCATNGISLFIDRFGRARGHTRLGDVAARVDGLALRRDTTFYTRHGDLFAGTVLAASLVLLAAAPRVPRRLPRPHLRPASSTDG